MIPRDIAQTGHPLVESKEYYPTNATLYAVCPSCRTLYLNAMGEAVICCRRHVSCSVVGTDEHGIDIQNECPVEIAYRVVDMAT